MSAPDLYQQGEERFGRITSRLYSFSSPFLGDFHRFVVSDILSFNPSSVLDIGCGSGDVLSRIASERQEIELFGIDPSLYMLRIAEKRIGKRATKGRQLEGRLHLSLGSSRNMPFKRKFDLIYSSLSFHHWASREESVKPILEMLSEGGSFVIYEFSRENQPIFRRWLFRSHSLSLQDAGRLEFNGYEKTTQRSGRYIKVVLKRRA